MIKTEFSIRQGVALMDWRNIATIATGYPKGKSIIPDCPRKAKA